MSSSASEDKYFYSNKYHVRHIKKKTNKQKNYHFLKVEIKYSQIFLRQQILKRNGNQASAYFWTASN